MARAMGSLSSFRHSMSSVAHNNFSQLLTGLTFRGVFGPIIACFACLLDCLLYEGLTFAFLVQHDYDHHDHHHHHHHRRDDLV